MIKVLDSSAVMALLFNECGSQLLTGDFMQDGVIGTVNLTEVHTNLVSRGFTFEAAWHEACKYIAIIEPFTLQHAKLAGSLIAQTRTRGLSLGDRACLALAITLNAPVYTTDQAWRDLNVGCEIRLLR